MTTTGDNSPKVDAVAVFETLLTGEHTRAIRQLVIWEAAYNQKVAECAVLRQQIQALQVELAAASSPTESVEDTTMVTEPAESGGAHADPGPPDR